MKQFKLIIVAVVLVFIGIFVIGNLSAFDTLIAFKLNLYVLDVQWEHRVYTLMAIALGLGFLLGVLAMVKPYLKMRGVLKRERKAGGHSSPGADISESTQFQNLSPEVVASAGQPLEKKDRVPLS